MLKTYEDTDFNFPQNGNLTKQSKDFSRPIFPRMGSIITRGSPLTNYHRVKLDRWMTLGSPKEFFLPSSPQIIKRYRLLKSSLKFLKRFYIKNFTSFFASYLKNIRLQFLYAKDYFHSRYELKIFYKYIRGAQKVVSEAINEFEEIGNSNLPKLWKRMAELKQYQRVSKGGKSDKKFGLYHRNLGKITNIQVCSHQLSENKFKKMKNLEFLTLQLKYEHMKFYPYVETLKCFNHLSSLNIQISCSKAITTLNSIIAQLVQYQEVNGDNLKYFSLKVFDEFGPKSQNEIQEEPQYSIFFQNFLNFKRLNSIAFNFGCAQLFYSMFEAFQTKKFYSKNLLLSVESDILKNNSNKFIDSFNRVMRVQVEAISDIKFRFSQINQILFTLGLKKSSSSRQSTIFQECDLSQLKSLTLKCDLNLGRNGESLIESFQKLVSLNSMELYFFNTSSNTPTKEKQFWKQLGYNVKLNQLKKLQITLQDLGIMPTLAFAKEQISLEELVLSAFGVEKPSTIIIDNQFPLYSSLDNLVNLKFFHLDVPAYTFIADMKDYFEWLNRKSGNLCEYRIEKVGSYFCKSRKLFNPSSYSFNYMYTQQHYY